MMYRNIRLITILMVAGASLPGCKSDYDREVDAAKATIRKATQHDWRNGIPFTDLIQAEQLCKKYGPLPECRAVKVQMSDITVSLSSCRNDMRSNLCRNLVAAFENSQFAYLLTVSDPVSLPDSPWYWSMPTTMLDVLVDHSGYRAETTHWWWEKWRLLILSFSAAAVFLLGTRMVWKYRAHIEKSQLERQLELKEQERSRRAIQARLQTESKARAEAESQRLILEQKRLASVKLEEERVAKKKAEEKAAQDKLASEREETSKLLQVAFQNTKKSTRRKNDPSPT